MYIFIFFSLIFPSIKICRDRIFLDRKKNHNNKSYYFDHRVKNGILYCVGHSCVCIPLCNRRPNECVEFSSVTLNDIREIVLTVRAQTFRLVCSSAKTYKYRRRVLAIGSSQSDSRCRVKTLEVSS